MNWRSGRPRLRAAVEVPLRDATVDAVLACYVLGHVDQLVALNALRRVLRPGGALFVVDITGGPIPELDYTAHHWPGETPEMTTHAADRLMGSSR